MNKKNYEEKHYKSRKVKDPFNKTIFFMPWS